MKRMFGQFILAMILCSFGVGISWGEDDPSLQDVKYTVVCRGVGYGGTTKTNIEQLSMIVTELMKKGWKPIGGAFMGSPGPAIAHALCQTMTR